MAMGFCYPGRLPSGGDAPPQPECASLWHAALLTRMPQIEPVLLVGGYVLRRHLGNANMTAAVRAHALAGSFVLLSHPSWRTTAWEQNNSWRGAEVLPRLKVEVARMI